MPKCEPWLAALIEEAGGHITFEQFMAHALQHPEHGYYAARVKDVGRGGDFSTSATLCPAFGEMIARWAHDRALAEFEGKDFAIIEIGSGNGLLAQNFLSVWKALNISEAAYFAIESSPGLREPLENRAKELGFRIEEQAASALEECEGRAIIFSNELVDAFPARQLCWDGDDWREVGLRLEGDQLVEGLLAFTDAVDADAPTRTRPGQRIFIHPSYHHWLKEQLDGWRAGRMLTIDYGAQYPSTECRAYLGQERMEGDAVYGHAGEQDITCDVNFSDLQRWGEQLAWSTVNFAPQSEFFEQWLPELETRRETDPALAYLANPMGAGAAFLTLEQRAN